MRFAQVLALVSSIVFIADGFSPKFAPLNPKQQKFQEYLRDPEKAIVIGIGSAGTGKTLFCCQEALHLLARKTVQRIVLTRPTVSVESEEIGFLPGDIQDKMSPWTRPIYDNLHEFYPSKDIEKLTRDHQLEVCPLGFMRGRTLRETVLILDEAQNTTPAQMKMILTRVGSGSRLFINGDLRQSDLKGTNGLRDLVDRLAMRYEDEYYAMLRDGFGVVRFEDHQIVRHPIVEKVVSLYTEET